jgi:hypothetical protein
MLVPETSVREDNLPAPWKYKIRAAWQVFAMQPKSIPQPVDQAAQGEFRTCVFAADTPHIGAAPFRTDLIHHRSIPLGKSPLRR